MTDYLERWKFDLTEVERDWYSKPKPKTRFDELYELYQLNLDEPFSDKTVWNGQVTHLDRMFWEDHTMCRTGNSQWRRLEQTGRRDKPKHLDYRVLAERFKINIHHAKRLETAFIKLQLDWKSVWHYAKGHITACNNNDDLLDAAIRYYEDLACLLPTLNTEQADFSYDDMNFVWIRRLKAQTAE